MSETMTVLDIVALCLGMLGTVCTIIFGYNTFKRKNKAEDKDDGQKDGIILTEIGYIKSGVDDIKHKQEKAEEKEEQHHVEMIERLSKVEQSTASAHHRIDTLEKKIEKNITN